MRTYKPMDHCGQCGKILPKNKYQIIRAYTVSIFLWDSWFSTRRPLKESATFTTCDSLECQLALYTMLTEDLKKRINKNKTNAVGPVARGAPGSAFNDPPDLLKKDPNGC